MHPNGTRRFRSGWSSLTSQPYHLRVDVLDQEIAADWRVDMRQAASGHRTGARDNRILRTAHRRAEWYAADRYGLLRGA